MERQPVGQKGNQPIPKADKKVEPSQPANQVGSGYSDMYKDEARKQDARREESQREPWSGTRRDDINLPGDITAKYH